MRIYNGKDSLVCLPLNANQRISIDPHSVSGDFLPTTEFITMVISAYNTDELALIVASSFEINICANIVGAVLYVVQSLDEAISRFAVPKEEKKEEVKIEVPAEKPEEKKCDCENSKCENSKCECEDSCKCEGTKDEDTTQEPEPDPQEEKVVEKPKRNKKKKN